MPRRVALIVPSLRGGGLERIVRDLALGLAARQRVVEVFCVAGLGPYAADLARASIPARDCQSGRLRVRGLPLRLVRALARFEPDIIHAHSGTWYPASVAKALLRRPRLIFTDHGRYPPEPKLRAVIERWCHSQTDRLITVSSVLASYDREFLRLAEPPEVVVNGIDLSAFEKAPDSSRSSRRDSVDVPQNAPVGIAVGRLEPVKNHSVLLHALAAAIRDTPELRLLFLGQGSLERELKRLTLRLGLEPHVRFLGYQTDVAGWLGAADFFAIPSATEGQPLSLLEAMGAGLPVVASRVGGIPETLGVPPGGILVEPGQPEELARALVRLAGDESLRTSLGALGRQRANDFSLDAMVERYSEIYEEVLRSTEEHPP